MRKFSTIGFISKDEAIMTILKSQHRDGRTVGEFLRMLLGLGCNRTLKMPGTRGLRYRCSLRAWHRGPHHDQKLRVRFAYSDEVFGGAD